MADTRTRTGSCWSWTNSTSIPRPRFPSLASPASLYEAFPPAEAKRIADRLEIHHTPKHGSWLNMAEIELSALSRDLPDRVAGKATLERHIAAWQRRRNTATTKADWRFTTADARIKLRKLYPITDS